MNVPRDQAQRTRFVTEIERNFSVVAAAGSGKTRAITDRIVELARHAHAAEWLPTLLVVTYTNRAAAEMQQRARQSIIGANVSPAVIAAFNRAFFGTIHSLCMKLLHQYGHYLGLPERLDHLDESNDARLWTEFVQQHTKLGGALEETQRRTLLRVVSAQTLMQLGRTTQVIDAAPPAGTMPQLDLSALLAFVPKANSQDAVARCRGALERWVQAWSGEGFVGPLPPCESVPLREVWDATVGPVRTWIQTAARHVAADVARSYRAFRLQRGAMTYGDQVALAAELLRHPEAAARIRHKGYRVILDEAQDTDPTQFDVLLEMTRPPEATGLWVGRADEMVAPDSDALWSLVPPRAGHFCMVGDFQQSIYKDRADLSHYRAIHDALLRSGAGEALEFSVTFRLDHAGLNLVNAALPIALNDAHGQVKFVPLQPRPGALSGQAARLVLGQPEGSTGWKDWEKARWEAKQVARWVRDQGLEKLRASCWSEVAVLCPRTRWLPALQAALLEVGLAAQVQSERAIKGDNPAYAWFTALAVTLAEPRNGYEVVGVLRDVFGISDQDLADYAQGQGVRFQIATDTVRTGVVGEILNQLYALRERVKTMALFSAMEEMVTATQLRARLQALPPGDFDGLEETLENLLTRAAAAEAEGATLETFAADLHADFMATRELRPAERDAVQLISGHKAKGSEWDAIIVPFFARPVAAGTPGYPRVFRHPLTRELLTALDKGDIDQELDAVLKAWSKQELERLLYVALTRARHTLVLVDDRPLFCLKGNKLPANAQAQLIQCGAAGEQAALFERLPDTVSASAETAAAQREKATGRAQEAQAPALRECAADAFEAGRKRAEFFIKRNPSALAEAALADADPAKFRLRGVATGPNAGQLYGTWWHEFIERLDWRAGVKAWDKVFAGAVSDSPDEKLSRQEWKLLRTLLANGSEFGRLLTAPGVIAHAEMPFLWAMNECECLDGIIDLAVFDPAAERWMILDWKTNRTKEEELPGLAEHYVPQLSAYWQAVTKMLGAEVSAGIYSTATGRWLPYRDEDLAKAWDKLRVNPKELERVLEEDRGRTN